MASEMEGKRETELLLLLAEERESKRLARALHHDLHQSLSLIDADLARAIWQIENDQMKLGMDLLKTTAQKVQQVTTLVQKMGMNIWPPVLIDMGILAAISWFCREFQVAHPRIHVELQTEIPEGDVPEFLKSVVYRVMRGAFSNIAEHSKADRVFLYIARKGATIEMLIRDNGEGFDLKKVQKGLGLESMRGWVSISGGFLRIESVERKGTTINASWPLGGDFH